MAETVKRYTISTACGEPDWQHIQQLEIGEVLWTPDHGIRAFGQFCHDSSCLRVRLRAVEKKIRAEYTAPLSPVHRDSCLEFFFMPDGEDRYFNFEINPNGCLHIGFGRSREDRTVLFRLDLPDLFAIRTARTADGWEAGYRIPLSFLILPQYLIIQQMGLLNTLHAIYLPNLFSAFGTFLMRQFFVSIPQELEDAARIDGCGHGRIYLRIMLPLIKPGLVSLGVLTLRFAWNNLMWPMIVNTEKAKMTLSAGLSYLQGQYVTDYPSIMAGALLATIPLIVVYAIFQRQFIEGIALTGIK